ncbi:MULTISPECIES: response regulator transcription factor [unclassified Leifsonia]|uniref:response regulator n=1 Tax=unclassified Leifsonia TaxID=2663824 RepID=UPI000B7D274C|nr:MULTISPECIES: response regulator transcription factor [unclassified Leifsonia]
MKIPTVCIADDHCLFREGLIALLLRDGRLDVRGHAGDGEAAAALVREERPSALFLDVDMPGATAQVTIAAVKRSSPETRIIVLTMHNDDVLESSLNRAGADAFLSKTIAISDLVAVTLNVLAGRPVQIAPARGADRSMTSREAEVLRLVAQASSNRDVASKLNIAEGTVRRHLSSIFGKLGATSRWDAVRKAERLGEIGGE